MSNIITSITALSVRLERAEKLMAEGKVHPDEYIVNTFRVESSSSNGSYYTVNGKCDCPDAVQREDIHKGWCKHKLAVELYRLSEERWEIVRAEEASPVAA